MQCVCVLFDHVVIRLRVWSVTRERREQTSRWKVYEMIDVVSLIRFHRYNFDNILIVYNKKKKKINKNTSTNPTELMCASLPDISI